MIKPHSFLYNLLLTTTLFLILYLVTYLLQMLLNNDWKILIWAHPISFLILLVLHYLLTADQFVMPARFPYQHLPLLIMTGIGLWAVNLALWEYVLPIPDYHASIDLVPTFNVFLVICIFAPVLEEILFRGIILKNLAAAHSHHLAIAISTLLFALIHLNPVQSTTALFLGFLVGYIYWWTHSLTVCILLHALVNSTTFIFIFRLPDAPAYHIPNSFLAFTGMGLLVIGYTLWFIQKKKEVTTPIAMLHLAALIGFGLFSYINLQGIRPLKLKEAIQTLRKNDLLLMHAKDSTFTYAKVMSQTNSEITLKNSDISSSNPDRIIESILMEDFAENSPQQTWGKDDSILQNRVISIYRNKKPLIIDDD